MEFLHVLKATGMGVSDMDRYVKLRSDGLSSLLERQEMLTKHLEVVAAKRKELENVENTLIEKVKLFQSVLNGDIDGDTLHCATGDCGDYYADVRLWRNASHDKCAECPQRSVGCKRKIIATAVIQI